MLLKILEMKLIDEVCNGLLLLFFCIRVWMFRFVPVGSVPTLDLLLELNEQ